MSQADASKVFRMPIQLRWSDLDAFNHVNNARYLTFVDQARNEWLDTIVEPWVTDEYGPVLAQRCSTKRRSNTGQHRRRVVHRELGNSSVTLGHRIVAGRHPALRRQRGGGVDRPRGRETAAGTPCGALPNCCCRAEQPATAGVARSEWQLEPRSSAPRLADGASFRERRTSNSPSSLRPSFNRIRSQPDCPASASPSAASASGAGRPVAAPLAPSGAIRSSGTAHAADAVDRLDSCSSTLRVGRTAGDTMVAGIGQRLSMRPNPACIGMPPASSGSSRP
jgi:acyl-CoA thioester hydrolase